MILTQKIVPINLRAPFGSIMGRLINQVPHGWSCPSSCISWTHVIGNINLHMKAYVFENGLQLMIKTLHFQLNFQQMKCVWTPIDFIMSASNFHQFRLLCSAHTLFVVTQTKCQSENL